MDCLSKSTCFNAPSCPPIQPAMDPTLFYTIKPPKRTQRCTDVPSFFSLPAEIRNLIYFMTLNPTSEGEIGSTKVLTLCKQTYEEAVRYLEPCIPVLELGARHRATLFRDPRANGKVNLFTSTVKTSKCYTYPRWSQIEVVRARCIVISMFQVNHIPFSKEPRILEHFKELLELIHKTSRLRNLIICIDWWSSDRSPKQHEILMLCRDLLGICQWKGIGVVLQYPSAVKLAPLSFSIHADDLRNGSNPLLDAFQWWAELLNMNINCNALDCSPYRTMDFTHDPYWNSHSIYRKENILYAPALRAVCDDKDTALLGSGFDGYLGCKPGKQDRYHLPGFYQLDGMTTPYEKTPECRSCLTVFSGEGELRTHLWEFESHKQSFHKKRWNPVARWRGSGGRTCWTCAWQFASLDSLNKHLDAKKHRRHGVVPRYVEDNAAFDRNWKWHKKNYNWL